MKNFVYVTYSVFYTWDLMHKEISVTSKMFYFGDPRRLPVAHGPMDYNSPTIDHILWSIRLVLEVIEKPA